MIQPRTLLLTVLCLAPAVAQDKKPTGKKETPPVKAQKRDPITDGDPVVQALDKFAKKGSDWKQNLPEPPKQTFPVGSEYFWHLATNKGELTIQLYADSAPTHVTSVIYLTRLGFFDGIVFHRVVKKFMAQGGDPLGNGTGSPGYMMDSELDGKRLHDKAGVLSAANSGQPKSEGSQFFLTFVPTPHLDGKHTVYGQVVEGLETLQAIEACGKDEDPATPSEKLEIQRAWITVAGQPNDAGKAGADKPKGSDKPKAGDKPKNDDKPKGESGK
jgi:cyclophilin family peptidyl-prolyl cis-trans isomerase